MPRPIFQTRSRIVDLFGALPVLIASADRQRVAIGFSSCDINNNDIQVGFSSQLDTDGFFFAPISGIEWVTYQTHGDLVSAEFWALHKKALNPFLTVIELVWTQG